MATPLYIPNSSVGGLQFLHIFAYVFISFKKIIIAILLDMKWYLIVILTCIS